jgi:hypothetical protein
MESYPSQNEIARAPHRVILSARVTYLARHRPQPSSFASPAAAAISTAYFAFNILISCHCRSTSRVKKGFRQVLSHAHVGRQDQLLHFPKGNCKKRERLHISQICWGSQCQCYARSFLGSTYWRRTLCGSRTLNPLVRTIPLVFSTKFCLAYSTCRDEPRLMTYRRHADLS